MYWCVFDMLEVVVELIWCWLLQFLVLGECIVIQFVLQFMVICLVILQYFGMFVEVGLVIVCKQGWEWYYWFDECGVLWFCVFMEFFWSDELDCFVVDVVYYLLL